MSFEEQPDRHTRTGNCWNPDVTRKCKKCGRGELCDVCHQHDEPRGECSVCSPCEDCDAERRHYESTGNVGVP